MENEDGVAGAVKAFFKQLPRKEPKAKPEPEPGPEPGPGPSPSSLFSISRCFGCS